jgi:hypothetical protein
VRCCAAQGGGSFEAKVAAAYSGKRIPSVTAKHRKRVCEPKTSA